MVLKNLFAYGSDSCSRGSDTSRHYHTVYFLLCARLHCWEASDKFVRILAREWAISGFCARASLNVLCTSSWLVGPWWPAVPVLHDFSSGYIAMEYTTFRIVHWSKQTFFLSFWFQIHSLYKTLKVGRRSCNNVPNIWYMSFYQVLASTRNANEHDANRSQIIARQQDWHKRISSPCPSRRVVAELYTLQLHRFPWDQQLRNFVRLHSCHIRLNHHRTTPERCQ